MGNHMTCGLTSSSTQVCKDDDDDDVLHIVHVNGYVEELRKAMTVSQMKATYPLHFICDTAAICQSLLNQSLPASLPADAHLELGRLFFLLPLDSDLTQSDILAMLARAKQATKRKNHSDASPMSQKNLHYAPPLPQPPSSSPSSSACSISTARKTGDGSGRTREVFLKALEENGRHLNVCNTPELTSDYIKDFLAQNNCRSWRPQLEMVQEHC